MDFAGPLPLSRNNRRILVICDRLTKYNTFIACPLNIDAPELERIFTNEIIRYYGLPKTVTTDRDTLFNSVHWKKFMQEQGIKTEMTTAYYQEANGQSERTI